MKKLGRDLLPDYNWKGEMGCGQAMKEEVELWVTFEKKNRPSRKKLEGKIGEVEGEKIRKKCGR